MCHTKMAGSSRHTLGCSCAGRRAVAHTTDDSSHHIPKGSARAVGFLHTRNIFRVQTNATLVSTVESVASVVNLREQYLLGRRSGRPRMGGWLYR